MHFTSVGCNFDIYFEDGLGLNEKHAGGTWLRTLHLLC